MDIVSQCKAAKESCGVIGAMTAEEKNKILTAIANALKDNAETILSANTVDLKNNSDKPEHILDRLRLTLERIGGIAEGLKKLASLTDPVGEIIEEWTVESGLKISKVRVPMGVIGIIYEARPNVTADAAGLCIKSGNAAVLRGSKDAYHTNEAIVKVMKSVIENLGYNSNFIQLIEDLTHEGAEVMMKCRDYIDVLIPRGSAKLINSVCVNATIPVIETGIGNCHAYVESSADYETALKIVVNAKMTRQSVCNSLESLLIDRKILKEFLPLIVSELKKFDTEVVGCPECVSIDGRVTSATEEDYYKEFLGNKISVKAVDGVNDAVAHINRYGSHHSDTIITRDADCGEKFLSGVDSSAVYLNASTRFTDGFEFGFGAEMGISTQKLHARGPLGLKELTSFKYKVYGQGQVRK